MNGPNIGAKWSSWAPRLQSLLRIVAAFFFMQSGTLKLFAFPIGMPPNGARAAFLSEFWFAGGPGPWSQDAVRKRRLQ